MRCCVVALLLSLAACQTLPPGAECRSLDGRVLSAPTPTGAARERAEAELAAAEQALRDRPCDRDAAIWVGRRLGYLGRYRDAIAVFSTALQQHRGDPFLLRHRGHRWISLREFGRAEADLALAAAALHTVPDAIEPDGQPTPGRPPHSTLHFNVHYHLGLARFLRGDFAGAERSWLDCLAVARNDEAEVAVRHWLWSVRMRRGNPAGAAAVVEPVGAEMDVVENRGYHQLCLVYAGRLGPAQIVVPDGSAGAALRFGLLHRELLLGDRTAALASLRELAALPGWSAFGVIAAEVEVARGD